MALENQFRCRQDRTQSGNHEGRTDQQVTHHTEINAYALLGHMANSRALQALFISGLGRNLRHWLPGLPSQSSANGRFKKERRR